MSIAQHYNDIASNYENIHPLRKEAVEEIIAHIKNSTPRKLIVDFGGGTGALLKTVQTNLGLPSQQLLLVDISAAMCEEAKRKGLPAVQRPYEKTGLADNAVSLAIFHESIHHTADKVGLQQELKKVLDADGRMLIFFQTDWYIEPSSEVLQKYIFMARKNRKLPEEVVDDLLGKQFQLVGRKELVSRNEVSADFVKDAILNAALSYWNKVHIEERTSDVGKIKGDQFALVRKIECFEFKM